MTANFNEFLARFDDATPAERQRVLDMLPQCTRPSTLGRVLWEDALRSVFEKETS